MDGFEEGANDGLSVMELGEADGRFDGADEGVSEGDLEGATDGFDVSSVGA